MRAKSCVSVSVDDSKKGNQGSQCQGKSWVTWGEAEAARLRQAPLRTTNMIPPDSIHPHIKPQHSHPDTPAHNHALILPWRTGKEGGEADKKGYKRREMNRPDKYLPVVELMLETVWSKESEGGRERGPLN
ncbi:hypothetical protein SRHO_G00014270 [Serrasalmus rhombeus]